MRYKARLTIYSNIKPTEILNFDSNSKASLLRRVVKTVKKLDNNDTISLSLSHGYIRDDGLRCYEPLYPFKSIVEIYTKEELIIKIKDFFDNIIFLD